MTAGNTHYQHQQKLSNGHEIEIIMDHISKDKWGHTHTHTISATRLLARAAEQIKT